MLTKALTPFALVLMLVGCARQPSGATASGTTDRPGATSQAPNPSQDRQDAANMPDAAKPRIASETPPPPSTVMYMIYDVDGDGADSYDIGNRSIASYWYGYEFDLAGKHYFTGFAYDTPEKFGDADATDYPAPNARVTLTQATFKLTRPDTDRPWVFDGAQRAVGEFGGSETADEIDTSRKSIRFDTPKGHLVLAVPTSTFVTGVTQTGYAIFSFNPASHEEQDSTPWRYLGTVAAGEENSAACDEGNVMPCTSSKGSLSFEQGEGDIPTVRVTMTGTVIDSPGKTRTLGPDDAVTYGYDAQKKEYIAR